MMYCYKQVSTNIILEFPAGRANRYVARPPTELPKQLARTPEQKRNIVTQDRRFQAKPKFG